MRRLRKTLSDLPVRGVQRIGRLAEKSPGKAAGVLVGVFLALVVVLALPYAWVSATRDADTRPDAPVAQPDQGRMPDATPSPSQPGGLPVESAMPTTSPSSADPAHAPVESWWDEQPESGGCVADGPLGRGSDGLQPMASVGNCPGVVEVEFSETDDIETIESQDVRLLSETQYTGSDYAVEFNGERILIVQVGLEEWWVCDRDSVIARFQGQKNGPAVWS